MPQYIKVKKTQSLPAMGSHETNIQTVNLTSVSLSSDLIAWLWELNKAEEIGT